MKTDAYDMIEGYLDGTLSPDATRELEEMAAADPDLASEIRAERLVRETLSVDRAALPVAAAIPSDYLMAHLAGSSVGGGAAGGSGAALVGGSGTLGTIFGTGLGLGLLVTAGLVGLLLGIVLFDEEVGQRNGVMPERVEVIEEGGNGASATEGGTSNRQILDRTESLPPIDRRDEEPVGLSSVRSQSRRPVDRAAPVISEASGEDDPSDEAEAVERQPDPPIDPAAQAAAMRERLEKSRSLSDDPVVSQVQGESDEFEVVVE